MKSYLRSSITISLLVASLVFVGVGCQQQEDPAAQEAGTLTTGAQTATLPTDTGTTTSEPFTVDLLPADDTSDTLPVDDQLGAGALGGTGSTLDEDTNSGDSPFGVEELDPTSPTIDEDDDFLTSSNNADEDIEAFVEEVITAYGTFTNKDRTPYQNLIGLEDDVTQSMQAYLDQVMAGGSDPDAPFFGRTTTVVSQTVLQEQATDTRVLVVAERQDVVGASASPTAYYVTYIVRLVEDQIGYLLDGVYEVSLGQNPLIESTNR